MAKVLVTGATGTIGGATVRALQQAGVPLRMALRDVSRGQALAGADDELVAFDFADPAGMQAAFVGIDAFLLVTPLVEDPTPLSAAALEAARAAGVGHVVRLSAAGADEQGPVALVRHHGVGERQVRESGLGWTILRPTFFMDNLITYQGDAIRNTGAFYGAAGDGRTAYVSSDDIGAVAATILRSPESHREQTYALTGGEALTDPEVAAQLSDTLGREIHYVDLGEEGHRQALVDAQMPPFVVEAISFLEGVKRHGWAAQISPAVEAVLERAPETLQGFLERNAQRL